MKKLLIILVFGILGTGIGLADGYKVGDKAKDFKLKNVDGRFVSLKDYKEAKGFIVIFTCNECPIAKLYEDRIIELNKEYAKKGYPVIAVNPNDHDLSPNDSFDKMKIRSMEKGFDFPYLFDEDHVVNKTYGATKTPHIFLLNKKEKDLVVSYIGAIDDNARNPEKVKNHYLASAIDALISGSKPDPDFTKAVGCAVKSKN